MPRKDGSTRTREAGITRHKLKTGTKYRVRVSGVDPVTGEPRVISQNFTTFEEARDFKRKTSHELRAGIYQEPSTERLLDLLTRWLGRAPLSERSRDAYQGVIDRIIAPTLGDVALGKLTSRMIADLYAEPRGQSYAVQLSAVMTGALDLAVTEEAIRRNPATGLRPAVRADEPADLVIWEPHELETFLDALADPERGHALWPLYFVASRTGMRLGELIALGWPDVAFDLGWVEVRKAKTAAGQRKIGIDAETLRVLRDQKADQVYRREALRDGWSETGAVFDRGDGKPWSRRTVEQVMARYVTKLGLPYISVHGIRHYHSASLLRAGIPGHVVAKRLGHASAATTLGIYARVMRSDDAAVVEHLEAMLKGEIDTRLDTILTRSRKAG